MPLFRNIHHNPEFFSDPQKFDPSRFEVGNRAYKGTVSYIELSTVAVHVSKR